MDPGLIHRFWNSDSLNRKELQRVAENRKQFKLWTSKLQHWKRLAETGSCCWSSGENSNKFRHGFSMNLFILLKNFKLVSLKFFWLQNLLGFNNRSTVDRVALIDSAKLTAKQIAKLNIQQANSAAADDRSRSSSRFCSVQDAEMCAFRFHNLDLVLDCSKTFAAKRLQANEKDRLH